MRVLVCNGFARELNVGQYAPTDLSQQMTERLTIGAMDSLYASILIQLRNSVLHPLLHIRSDITDVGS